LNNGGSTVVFYDVDIPCNSTVLITGTVGPCI